MPRTIETTVYTFDELDSAAKERARDWYREASADDFADFHADGMYEDFETCARILGITFSTHAVKLMGGSTRRDPDIYWSGFASQGDGASYAGDYRYAKGAAKAIRAHAPLDAELHRIADGLQAIQKGHGYKLTASISRDRGNYSHSGTMGIAVEDARGSEPTIADDLRELLRDFADWMYSQLEEEYEYQTSNEAVDENIRANEYTFTESGKREG